MNIHKEYPPYTSVLWATMCSEVHSCASICTRRFLLFLVSFQANFSCNFNESPKKHEGDYFIHQTINSYQSMLQLSIILTKILIRLLAIHQISWYWDNQQQVKFDHDCFLQWNKLTWLCSGSTDIKISRNSCVYIDRWKHPLLLPMSRLMDNSTFFCYIMFKILLPSVHFFWANHQQ